MCYNLFYFAPCVDQNTVKNHAHFNKLVRYCHQRVTQLNQGQLKHLSLKVSCSPFLLTLSLRLKVSPIPLISVIHLYICTAAYE